MSHGSLTKHVAKGMKTLFFIQIFSTLSFSVFYSTLVLYATQGLKLNEEIAIGVTGSFVAFNFFLHLLGGYIGGRFISYRDLFCIGMLLQIVGCIIIALLSVKSLFWGLSIFLTGCGLNVTCVNCMLTQLFEPHDKNRETAFLWNYSGMNIGFLIGFTMSGLFQMQMNYRPLFYAAAVGNLIAFIITMLKWKILCDVNTHYSHAAQKRKKFLFTSGIFMILILIVALRWFINNTKFSNNVIFIIGGVMLIFIIGLAIQERQKVDRKKIWAFFILILASLVFWTLYQMAPMGLMLFLTNNVNRRIGTFLLPPQWLLNINTLIIIIGGPTMAYMNRKMREKGHIIRIPVQFIFALFLIGIAYAILPIGIYFSDQHGVTALYWIIICYVLQSLGELFIAPIGYAMIGQLISTKIQGLMMGTWLMIVGVAATVSNYFSQKIFKGITQTAYPHITNPLFSETFNILGWSAILIGFIIFTLISFLKNLIQENVNYSNLNPHPYNTPNDIPH